MEITDCAETHGLLEAPAPNLRWVHIGAKAACTDLVTQHHLRSLLDSASLMLLELKSLSASRSVYEMLVVNQQDIGWFRQSVGGCKHISCSRTQLVFHGPRADFSASRPPDWASWGPISYSKIPMKYAILIGNHGNRSPNSLALVYEWLIAQAQYDQIPETE